MNDKNKIILPTIEKFQASVQQFFGAQYDYDYFGDGNPIPTVRVYIDPLKRVEDNLPAWYAMITPDIYKQVVTYEDAILDSECGGEFLIRLTSMT